MTHRVIIVNGDPGISTLKTPGFVYFMQAIGGGLIKIGWATKPEVRMATMQAMCPLELRILAYSAGTGRDEKALHSRFAHARRHGEWFSPIPELLTLIVETKAAAPPPPKPCPPPREALGPPWYPDDTLDMRGLRIAMQSLDWSPPAIPTP